MNKKLLLTTLICTSINFFSQAQVGVGTTTPNGALDVTSTTNGFVPPRVALTATNVGAPIVNPNGGGNPIAGTVVYNTATAGTSPNNVAPGLYYWNGTRWVAFAGSPGGLDWSLTGNTGTSIASNFLGTSDNVDFAIRTNNTERMRVLTNGRIAVNTTNVSQADNQFEVTSTIVGDDAITGNSVGTGGRGVQGNSTLDGTGVFGYNDGTGIGIVGTNVNTTTTAAIGVLGNLSTTTTTAPTSNLVAVQGQVSSISATAINALNFGGGMGLYAQTTGPTPTTAGSNAAVYASLDQPTAGNQDVAAIIGSQSNINQGTGGYAGPLAASSNSSLGGVAGTLASKVINANTDSYLFGVIGDVLRDSSVGSSTIPDRTGGVMGYNGSNAWGVLGYRASNGNTYSVYGGGGSNNGTIVTGNGGRMSNTNNNTEENNLIGLGINGGFMGGYIKGDQYGLMTKGDEFGMYVAGNTLTNKPIVQLTEGTSKRIATYATTSTSVDVTTRGKGKLNNGETFVAFDTNFSQTATISEDELNITITPMGATNGVYVSKITSTGFFVKENLNGKSNANFSWTAISTQKGYKNGVKISNEILANDYDKNMNEVMFNEADTKNEAKPIMFDGTKIKFERYNEPIENQKKSIPVNKRERVALENEKPKQ